MGAFTSKHNLKLAYRSLRAARSRNFLTMLGIIIGVMAVILVVCIGEGIKRQISGQLGQYGKRAIVVQPQQNDQGGISGLGGFTSARLSQNDLSTVQKASGISYAVPVSTATGSMSGDKTVRTPFIIATTDNFSNIVQQRIAYGGFFDDGDSTKSVVLGANAAKALFKDNAPLGEQLTWRGQHFIVAGIFDTFAAPPFSLESNFNDAVFVPYSSAQSISRNTLSIYQILAQTDRSANTKAIAASLSSQLKASHGGADDIVATPASQVSNGSSSTLGLLTTLVYGAAIIALIVGGIGIMNIMLVSVTERMHEIGLRKAIGATNRQILHQFMAEAFLLSATGAVLGVLFSCISVGLMRLFTSIQPVLVWQVILIAPVIAVAIGMLFGSLPALKAARKDPIEALRHE